MGNKENEDKIQPKILDSIKNHIPNSYDVSQSYGGFENLLISLGQKPFNSQDYEAQGILQAFKQDSFYNENQEKYHIKLYNRLK